MSERLRAVGRTRTDIIEAVLELLEPQGWERQKKGVTSFVDSAVYPLPNLSEKVVTEAERHVEKVLGGVERKLRENKGETTQRIGAL